MSLILDTLLTFPIEELMELVKLFDPNYVPSIVSAQILVEGKILPFLREAVSLPDASRKEVVHESLKITAGIMETGGIEKLKDEKDFVTSIFIKYKDDLDKVIRELDREQRIRFLKEWNKAAIKSRADSSPIEKPLCALLKPARFLRTVSLALGAVFPFNIYKIALIMLSLLLGPLGWILAAYIMLYQGIPELMKNPHSKVAVIMLAAAHRFMEQRENDPAVTFEPCSLLGLERNAPCRAVEKAYKTIIKELKPADKKNGTNDDSRLARQMVDWAYVAAGGGRA